MKIVLIMHEYFVCTHLGVEAKYYARIGAPLTREQDPNPTKTASDTMWIFLNIMLITNRLSNPALPELKLAFLDKNTVFSVIKLT